ncbi:PREDICTED: protein PIH1D3-like [Amphimedon queenslandica]|uniref:PIH1D1/2/3 CS-like domain-containing protein n=1 Tax=Amphimedon queenslandica TaxID=400682 RepID=A0A1X7V2E8_AMPQE|nr:PREDICTED: protein PIH1D3-like [Amphimedon queenslandica]|eukprot:XP_003385842.1 PREDICTED: protein PIH1D3-like [Amphimedon queenslandica]
MATLTPMAGEANSLALLNDLLHPPEKEGQDEDQPEKVTPSPYAHPGSIGPPASSTTREKERSDKGIWDQEEVQEATEIAFDDDRAEPEYEMMFKQAVTTEDIFLGMTNKTPLTSACEDLFLRIHLPNVQYKDVDLVVTSKHIDCQTPIHHLGLYLPHTVDHKSGKAKWLSEEQILEITLRVTREYDFLNK